MLGEEDKEEEKKYYKMVRTSVSSTQGYLIHSQDKGHGLMALDGVQPKILSKHRINIKSKIECSVSHLCKSFA